MPKRNREDEVSDLHQELVDLFAGRGPEFLWDTSSRLQLRWPTLYLPALNADYFYIGREGARALFEAVLRLSPGNVMQILGAKGSGKTTVMATIAAFLHGTGHLVVYISGHEFTHLSSVSTLRKALLLCCSNSAPDAAELLEVPDELPDLVKWCTCRSLLLVVDDWDMVEKEKDCCDALMSAGEGNMLVRISSIISRERHAWDRSDKDIRTQELDGPFTRAELQTWISHADLPSTSLENLDYFTGCMPRLLSYYAECKGDDVQFLQRLQRPVTNRIQSELVEKLKDKQSVEAVLELVTSHDGLAIPPLLYEKVGYCYYILCPFLRSLVEKTILDEASKVEKRLLVDDMQVWIAAIENDLEADVGARNPARIGWNVEGLVIGAIRVQGQVLPGYPFVTYRTYGRTQELKVLKSLKIDQLRNGVLLGPEAFNEKAVDIVYVILRDGILEVIALQISVAQWKTREGKKSHETWRKEVLPKWNPGGGVSVESKFLYLMPEAVKVEDIPDVEVRKFSEICSRLCFLDALVLEAPPPVQKSAKRKCVGIRKDGGSCQNSLICPDCEVAGYCRCEYLCYHHQSLSSVL